MSRFHGMIGFAEDQEIAAGKYKSQIVERPYYGDIYRNTRQYDQTDTNTGTVTLRNEFSIIADAYANENYLNMRYIVFMGKKLMITTVDAANRPRLILTVGGEYHGR